jgi:integrase
MTLKLIRRQSLGIYIYAKPKDANEKMFNAQMMQKAEAIRCRVFDDVINERYDFFSQRQLSRSFLDYLKAEGQKKGYMMANLYKHFDRFTGGKCSFGEINVFLCEKFKVYITTVHGAKKNTAISSVTASHYWSLFRSVLRQTYKDGLIRENVDIYLCPMKFRGKVKDTLNIQELRILYRTPCNFEVLKRAALFSCLTGLRKSDIVNLTWNNVREYNDGGKYIEFVSQKTKSLNIVPISEEAYNLLPAKEEGKERVFWAFKRNFAYYALQEWIKRTGITKHITFHCFRHTYASLLVEMGTDVYTVQSLLDHKDVKTTQIYARHSDVRKREAAQRIVLNDGTDGKDFDPFANC